MRIQGWPGLQATDTTSHLAQATGEWRYGKSYAFPHVPTPQRRLRTNVQVQKTGQVTSRRLPSIYSPAQVTWLFQSTNAPCGLSRQAQTWSSKNEGMLKRFGAPTKLKTFPSSTGGVLLLAASQLAESRMNSTPTRVILPLEGS